MVRLIENRLTAQIGFHTHNSHQALEKSVASCKRGAYLPLFQLLPQRFNNTVSVVPTD